MAKSILNPSDLRKRYKEYPCPKCPPGYRQIKVFKNGKRVIKHLLSQCKCVSVLRTMGAGKYLKERLKQYKYGKSREWKG